jgi:enediyne biosynthesis protein E7
MSVKSAQLKEHALYLPLLRLMTNPTAALTTIHDNYGELVLTKFFNKKILFICKPEHFERIFNLEAKGSVSRDCLYEAKKTLFGDGLLNSRAETWSNQRRLMQPFFTKEAVAVWHGLMLEETDKLVQRLMTGTQAEINLSRELKTLVQSIFIRILFGRSAITSADALLIDSVDTITKGLVPLLVTELLGKAYLNKLFFYQNRKLQKAIKYFNTFVAKELEQNSRNHDGSLISLMAQAQDKKSGYFMAGSLLNDEAINLFLAGQDTTINTLVWFFYLIGKHEAVHQKITEEISWQRQEPLTPENLSKLVYTKAALHETLRIFPAAAGLSRQPVAEDFELDGNKFSQDTIILLSLNYAHHDNKLWERPDKFYPEHFANPELAAKRHRFAFLPFGGGIHNCIGRHLAELEMMIIIVSLLRKFSIKHRMDVKKAISITVKPDRDVRVTITKNKP